jgi:hypothetical protein
LWLPEVAVIVWCPVFANFTCEPEIESLFTFDLSLVVAVLIALPYASLVESPKAYEMPV